MNKTQRHLARWSRKYYTKANDHVKSNRYLPRKLVLGMDMCFSILAFTLSYFFAVHLGRVEARWDAFLGLLGVYTGILVFFFWRFKTYYGIIRYSSFKDIFNIFQAVVCAHLVMWGVNNVLAWYTGVVYFPDIELLLNCGLVYSFIITKKAVIILVYEYITQGDSRKSKRIPLLVCGISSTQVEMARVMMMNPESPYMLVGFVSLTGNAVNKKLNTLPVFNGCNIEALVDEHEIGALLINPTELERAFKQELADICIRRKIDLLSMPAIQDWKNTSKNIQMKKVRIEDLLGRIPIKIDVDAIGESLCGRTIMVTGAAGSIGSEIVRQIGKFQPKLLLLCDLAETPMHELRLELEERFPNLSFIPFVIDVRNERAMSHLFETYHPEFIYHAAAYKHVPLMEECPNEAIMTNVWGTKNLVDLSVKYRAESFVMISTDKAVNPTNVMGCSKRIAEIYVQSKAVQPEIAAHTRFITTRFGNVLGSNGSVIPRFREQIEKGGPVTVTHKDIIRYFMTIPEACRLVLEAGNMGKGGEIYVFDMGDPVKISDLAAKMIRLAGFEPYVDIPIHFTGLRPGEKLYEELLNDEEQTKPTYNKKIKIGKVREYENYAEIHELILDLIKTAQGYDMLQTVRLMKEIVPEFISKNSRFEALDIPVLKSKTAKCTS